MLAVVVDDHDMGVTHVIRGDDHLNNAARQMGIYHAMGWEVPVWAHIPLIHGPDGKKLSKRHGALGVDEYQRMGYPAAGMRNYLARLGWSHGDDEFFTDAQAQAWFGLEGIGKSPARFDFKKLDNSERPPHRRGGRCGAACRDLAYRAANGLAPLSQAQRDGLSGHVLPENAPATCPNCCRRRHFVLAERPWSPTKKAASALRFSIPWYTAGELTPHLQSASWTERLWKGC